MNCDVAIIGGGLAGLTLARQLLLTTSKRVVVLDRRAELPPAKQKVGEATVQLSGFYLAKVLDLEEHLLRDHFMKYNLRFHWKTPGRRNDRFEDYSQSYIRNFSNIASYQLDRNRLECELLRLNALDSRFDLVAPASELIVELRESGPHELAFVQGGRRRRLSATWVVDASGRGRVLAKQLGLKRQSEIEHGASFMWVDGLLNIEKLTDLGPAERMRADVRQQLGHLPLWLATNHFMGEGYWLWVIPLPGKTSIGLVYDTRKICLGNVSPAPRLVEWICREWPLFARDLPFRRITDQSAFRDFSYDCARTISAARWALTGEAGRFTDPLYSPGGDLIAIHNTLIADAITRDPVELSAVCVRYEQLMRAFYDAYVPSYALSYEALGDQATMTLKYTWELSVYFAMYVFPFINGLFTVPQFTAPYLMAFSRLGRINAALQALLAQQVRSSKPTPLAPGEPQFIDLMENARLQAAESTFYQVGVSPGRAVRVVQEQVASLQQLAKEISARLGASDPLVSVAHTGIVGGLQ